MRLHPAPVLAARACEYDWVSGPMRLAMHLGRLWRRRTGAAATKLRTCLRPLVAVATLRGTATWVNVRRSNRPLASPSSPTWTKTSQGLGPLAHDVLAADRSKFTVHGMGVRGAGPNAIAKQRAAEDAAKRMEELRRNIADLEALGSAQPLPPSVAGEVDPFSRTPYRYGTRSPECPNQNRHTRAKHRGLGIRCCQA
jgi:hypothetical protein